jgi:hypothetical protein
MVGVTGSIPVVPTIDLNALAKIAFPFISDCPSFAQKRLFSLRSDDLANDDRMCRG